MSGRAQKSAPEKKSVRKGEKGKIFSPENENDEKLNKKFVFISVKQKREKS